LVYIKSHPDSYSSVITLGYLKNKLHKDTVQSIFNNYTPKIKNSKYAKIIAIYLKEKISKVGDIYHDFEAFDKNSEKIVFSKIKKNYTLLDFTAANCGPCIQSVEELKDLNKTYKDSLTIISFSCDAKKETWLNSLKRDSISWTSVWDGKGRYSETSIKYGVSGFPTFFLIDPEGKIIDKWGGYRKGSLKNKLKKIFTK
jgi:thioredoxin-related protein